jgi:soluble lytic murein transglycosylase-like protein/GNAT superfamily N-acetyltransferase
MNAMTYRFATPGDAALLARLNAQLVADGADFGPEDPAFLEQRMRRWLKGRHDHALLFHDACGELVAYALYREYTREIYLRQFLVLPAARGTGVGRQAYHLLRSKIWSTDKRLTLEVLSSNHAAYRFWRSLGYRDCAMTLEIPLPATAPQARATRRSFAVPSRPLARPVRAALGALLPAAATIGTAPLRLVRSLRRYAAGAAGALGHGAAVLAFTGFISLPIAAASPTVLAASGIATPAPAQEYTPSAAVRLALAPAPAQGPSARIEAAPASAFTAQTSSRTPPPRAKATKPGALTNVDLRALRASGGHCAASIYRTAWSVAQANDMEPAWILAVIEAESSCRPDAVSNAGALGLMQLVPGSGARDAYRLAYGRDGAPAAALLRDPQANIRLGVAYLRGLHRHFFNIGSAQARLLLAVASYNCGADLLDGQLPTASAGWDAAEAERWIGTHLPLETKGYVMQVRTTAQRYKTAITAAHATPAALTSLALVP